MNKEEQQQFDELQLKLSKIKRLPELGKLQIAYVPEKDGDDGGSRYWEFFTVNEKGYEYGRENFFSIKQLIEAVNDYLE
jgi:hypothetical protein